MGMSAGYDQAHKRWFQIRMFNIIGRNMSLDMMDSYQRQFFRIADCLRFCHSHQQCSNQTRAIGDSDSIQILQRNICLCQCLFYYLIYFFNMFSGCDFRHHPSIQSMQCNLRRNYIRQNGSSIFHYGSCRFITGTLNCQN